MKLFLRILLVLVFVAAVIALFSDRVVARYAKAALEEATGFGVQFDELHVGLLKSMVRVKNLTLTNPSEFPHPEAISVRELSATVDPWSLLGNNLRLYAVTIDVPRVVMVRTPNGSNFDALSKAGKKDQIGRKTETRNPSESSTGEKPTGNKPARSIRIDELNVSLGEMEMRTYRQDEGEPNVVTIPVGFDRSYENVTNVQEVAVQLGSELVVLSGFSLLRQLNENSKSSNTSLKDAFSELADQFRKKKAGSPK